MKKQSLEEFINSQPYYGHCTTEYLEGIEVGAKWQEEQSKEMEEEQSLKMPTYNLNELADEYYKQFDNLPVVRYNAYVAGFQKALELLTFKQQEQ